MQNDCARTPRILRCFFIWLDFHWARGMTLPLRHDATLCCGKWHFTATKCRFAAVKVPLSICKSATLATQ